MSLPVSVVVVSRDRPDALYRCVLGLSQVQYTSFEIVVVADALGLAALGGFEGKIKTVLFEEPNISAARNIGIAHSAGEVVAFIDDDAVPEPTWLTHLTEPLTQQDVSTVGGFVIGRNGISFQWKARVLDQDGFASDIEVDETRSTVIALEDGQAAKTEGTNMAIRRDVLIGIGGFDPAYHFYLDETDLNMRLAKGGYVTAISPLAQVHHGFAASARRRADRAPSDLFDIGASWAVFQRKHIERSGWVNHWSTIVKSERRRVVDHMISGALEPRAVRHLMGRLSAGYEVGMSREINGTGLTRPEGIAAFLPCQSPKRESVVLITRPFFAQRCREMSRAKVAEGEIVTIFNLSSTALFHRCQFHSDGYWEQVGGLFGKSLRSQRLFRGWSRKRRIAFEVNRLRGVRSFDL